MKAHSFSAPLCVTLSGDAMAAFGRPALMVSIKKHVVVSLSDVDVEPDEILDSVYVDVYKEVFGRDPKGKRPLKVSVPYDADFRGVQAALIVCYSAYLLAQKSKNKPLESDIQKVSYAVERKRFHQFSHAQTVCCIQGGLIYYRKEFEFYKTIVKLPMKLPKGFLNKTSLKFPSKKHQEIPAFSQKSRNESEIHTKRLVFAISQENIREWKENLLQTKNSSDLTISLGEELLEESYHGLTVSG